MQEDLATRREDRREILRCAQDDGSFKPKTCGWRGPVREASGRQKRRAAEPNGSMEERSPGLKGSSYRAWMTGQTCCTGHWKTAGASALHLALGEKARCDLDAGRPRPWIGFEYWAELG